MEKIVDTIDGQAFPRTEEVCCPLCGESHAPRRIVDARFSMQALVAYCDACRLGYQTPRPSEEASLAYMNWRWSSSDAYVGDRAMQLKRAAKQIDALEAQIGGATAHTRGGDARLLIDFGAGAGAFVRAAIDRGWRATGVETSASARDRAREFYGVELLEAFPEEPCDVVTLWDVVEHLRDPIGLLSMIRGHLAPKGAVVLETGNYENWRRTADGDAWSLYLLDHQYYFTPSSLAAVCDRAGYARFELLDCSHKAPRMGLKAMLKHPGRVRHQKRHWREAMARWPEHGDINVMLGVGWKG